MIIDVFTFSRIRWKKAKEEMRKNTKNPKQHFGGREQKTCDRNIYEPERRREEKWEPL